MRYIPKRFNISDHLKKYIFNTGWLFGEKIIRMAVNVLVGIYMARYLGPARFGILNYGASIVALFLPFAGFGIHGILVRDLVTEPQNEKRFLGTAFGLKIFGGIITSCIVILLMATTEIDWETRVVTYIITGTIILQAFQVFDLFFQSKIQSKYIVQSQIISLIVSSLLKLFFIIYHYPLVYFAFTYTLEALVLAIGYWIYYSNKDRTPFHWLFDKAMAKRLLHESWPLILSGFVITVYMRIDQVMIKQMVGNAALGNYSAAVRISESYYFLPLIICNSLFPAIINGKNMGIEEYHRRLQKLYNFLTLFAFSFALLISVLANPIANLVYGNRFEGVGPVLAWHIWAGLFVFWGTATGKWLTLEKIQIYETVNTIVGSIINVVLNLLLIPLYGIIGAALATLAAYFFAGFLGYGLFPKSRLPFTMIIRSFNFYRSYKEISNV